MNGTAAVAVSFFAMLAVGLAAVGSFDPVPRVGPAWARGLFRLSLGAGAGAAITSMLFLMLRIAGWAYAAAVLTVEALCAIAGATVWARCRRASRTAGKGAGQDPAGLTPSMEDAPGFGAWRWALAAAFLVVFACVVVRLIQVSAANPLGMWDAWAIWNLRARYLAGPFDWKVAASPLLTNTHPEYPLLLSAFVARGWSIARDVTMAIPAVTGLMFFTALTGLLVGALTILRGVGPAMIGGMLLLSQGPLLFWASAQYSDVPLAFFCLATMSLLLVDAEGPIRPQALAWAGFCAGAAAWTKLEGSVFAMAVLGLFPVAARYHHGSWRPALVRWGHLLAGATPGVLLTAWFRIRLAPPASDVPRTVAEGIARVVDPGRYAQIGRALLDQLLGPGSWLGPPQIMVGLLALLVYPRRDRRSAAPLVLSAIATGVMVASYLAAYLVTPRDLAWHLQTSLDRVLLQVWPSCVLLLCCLLPRETTGGTAAGVRT